MSDEELRIIYQCQTKLNCQLQNSIFKLQNDHSPDTYYIPVYPRAYIEEIVNVDTERRTVTAKFILMITISLMNLANQEFKEKVKQSKKTETSIKNIENVSNKLDKQMLQQIKRQKQIRQYIREHLIIEFGYNQIIYIPQNIISENCPYLISKVMNIHDHDNYVTYRIKGQIQCNAYFDLMFFPYRKIEVENNLCIRSQQFQCQDGKEVLLKYNIMMLMEEENERFSQFLPYSLREKFGPYQLKWSQLAAITSQKAINTIDSTSVAETLKHIVGYTMKHLNKNQQKVEKGIASAMILMSDNEGPRKQKSEGWQQQFTPYKHMVFKFEMISMKIAFLLQQEIPIWVITIITLFLFFSEPSIGNKYSCIILLLISFLAVVTDFRLNNPSEPILTFFQVKLVLLLIVPILLIFSTYKDYYQPTNFQSRSSQIQNPYFIASLVISIVCFVCTIISLIVIVINEKLNKKKRIKHKTNKAELMIDWMNMIELKWGNNKLKKKIYSLWMNKWSGLKFLNIDMEKSLQQSKIREVTLSLVKPSVLYQVKGSENLQDQSLIV